MKILLSTLNAKYIHKNLALRWLYVTRPAEMEATIQEFTINDELSEVCRHMDLDSYDVLGLSVYIWNAELTRTWISMIKQIAPNLRIVLGGPEVSFANDDWFDLPIEAIVQGEGEAAFWGYLQDEPYANIKTVRGINDHQGEVDLAWLETFTDPYFLPFDLADIDERYLYVECSRGCPYHCRYCLSSTTEGVRFFSLPYLERIFKHITEHAIRQVKFLDRTFNIRNQRTMILLEDLNRLDTVSNFHLELVAELVSDELLTYMREQLRPERFRFEIGVQSFNVATLKEVDRYTDLDRLRKVVQVLVSKGVIVHTDLIAGLPFEDIASFAQSYDELFKLGPAEIQVGILKLLKGTILRERAATYGMKYDPKPPYAVISNLWLSSDDLAVISGVYTTTEKCYNKGRLIHTLRELSTYFGLHPFVMMERLGCGLDTLPHPYQQRDLFLAACHGLRGMVPDPVLQAALAVDYYRGTRQRPKQLFAEADKRDFAKLIYHKGLLNEHQLYNYAVITPALFAGQLVHQLIVYGAKQQAARRYMIDLEQKKIEELR